MAEEPSDFEIEPPAAVLIARILWRFIVDLVSIGVALFGAWVASSIAAYLNGPIWLVLVAGLSFGILLPLGFEAWHRFDRERYGESDADHPWVGHRILRNALLLNLAFLVALLFVYPRGSYTAVTTRGDWLIESSPGEMAAFARKTMFAALDRAEFLFRRGDDANDEFDDSYKFEPLNVGWRETPLPSRGNAPESTPEPSKRKPEKPSKSSEKPSKTSEKPTKTPEKPSKTPELPSKPAKPSKTPEIPSKPELPKTPEPSKPEVPPKPTKPAEPPPRERPTPVVEAPTKSDSTEEGRVEVDDEGVPLIVMHGDPDEPDDSPSTTTSKPSTSAKPNASSKPAPRSRPRSYVQWLADPRVHPIVDSMPREAQATYKTVAAFIRDNEDDAFERVKAIHDYIASTTRYIVTDDLDSLPASDPTAVFNAKAAVCAGYARLFQAMVEAIGGRAVYISGDARFSDGSVPGTSHAWNAVEIEGQWYLVDVTWDAGYVDGSRYIEKYRTEYLLTPPDIFAMTHFPRDERWQLLEEPLTRGEFMRQPLLLPRFFAYGLDLVEPTRSQTSAEGSLRVIIENPKNHSVLVAFQKVGVSGEPTRCTENDEAKRAIAHCYFPGPGTYAVQAFAAFRGQSRHEQVARFEIQSR